MIRRYTYGTPLPSGAVVKQLPAESAPLPYFDTRTEDDGSISFSLSLHPEEVLFGLGQAVRGIDKRVKVYADAADKDAWNRGEIDVLLIHPSSCGYGLNLQEGGHHIIWFTPTWNLEEYIQATARLHRQGQKYPVIVHRLLVKGGRDEDVVKSLGHKDEAQERLLRSLKARIDAVQSRADRG